MGAILLHPRYLLIGPYPNGPLAGAALTSWVALWACMMATAAGVGCMLLPNRLDATPDLRRLARLLHGLLTALRVIPILIPMFWTYFLIPMTLDMSVPETAVMVAALAAVGTTYTTQSIEAGLHVIGAGQCDAALALSMSPPQTLLTVALPQAWRIMLPSLADQWVPTVRDTPLVYVAGVVELSTAASQVSSHTVTYPAEVFDAVVVLYFLLCAGIEALPNWLRTSSRTPTMQPVHMSTQQRFLHQHEHPVSDAMT